MGASMVTKSAGSARVEIDLDHGARLSSLRVAGHELLAVSGPSPTEWGCFVMAPFAGRLDRGRLRIGEQSHQLPINMAPHAIHGTVFDRPARQAQDQSLVSVLGERWPVPGRVVQRIDLRPDRLVMTIEIHTEGAPFPASCGWHPWFRRRLESGAEARLDLRARSMLVRGPDGLPSGEHASPPPPGPWDDCFTGVDGAPKVRWGDAVELNIQSTADYWVVYDERPDAFCVEPQSAPPNSLPAIVAPGRPLIATTTWTWTVAPSS